jgi:hypothetical protein
MDDLRRVTWREIAGLGWRESWERSRNPMLRPAQTRVPERDCIRLRSVGCRQHRLSRRHKQELGARRVRLSR